MALQRGMAEAGGVVMDGRDIGTVVFPNADLKFFLDADVTVRAERRRQDLVRAGKPAELAAVRDEVVRRDARDRGRAVSPLQPAPEAVRIDTTALDADAVQQALLSAVARFLGRDNS